ncbi:MAG: hypothetical protein ACE5HI_17015, partial [bacterium]
IFSLICILDDSDSISTGNDKLGPRYGFLHGATRWLPLAFLKETLSFFKRFFCFVSILGGFVCCCSLVNHTIRRQNSESRPIGSVRLIYCQVLLFATFWAGMISLGVHNPFPFFLSLRK